MTFYQYQFRNDPKLKSIFVLTLWGVSSVVKSFFFVPGWQLGSILQLLQQILGHFRGFWAAAAIYVGLMIVFGILQQVKSQAMKGQLHFGRSAECNCILELKKDNTNEFLRGCELIGENLGLYQLMISHSSSENHPVQSVTTFTNPNYSKKIDLWWWDFVNFSL